MLPWTRLWSSLRPTAKRRSSASLGRLALERLEERWTPTVEVTLGSDWAAITDSDSGKTYNSIEIIDDLDTLTTYVRVNDDPLLALAPAGTLLANLTIQMGSGKDKVTFTTIGDAQTNSGDVARTIDLGSNRDSLTINLGAGAIVADGFNLVYNVVGDTTGSDAYTITGDLQTGKLTFDASTAPETSGDVRRRQIQLRCSRSRGGGVGDRRPRSRRRRSLQRFP